MTKATSSLDKKPEVVLDAIYQVQRPNGEFKRKYVKTIRTYGEDIEAEIVLDRDHPELEGERLTVPASLLLKPDTYPKFMFQPTVWQVKATQTLDQMKAEAETVIEACSRPRASRRPSTSSRTLPRSSMRSSVCSLATSVVSRSA